MPRRLLLKEGGGVSAAPPGFVNISSQGGQLQTSNEKGVSQPVSAQGEKFIAHGDVFQGELVYLNSDGTVSIPGNITNDENLADNIIGIFLEDADDGQEVSIITKGIVSIDSIELIPRTIYYINTKGKLTPTVTPFIFGKSLTSEKIAVDISFVQSILNVYGITPTFDKLNAVWVAEDASINISWSSEDKITKFEILSLGFSLDHKSNPLSSTANIKIGDYLEDYDFKNGEFYVFKITNEKNVTSEFKFQILGGLDDDSKIAFEYSGLGTLYDGQTGFFKDISIFSRVKVHVYVYSAGQWSFAEDNSLPIKKLFVGNFVQKDDLGQYVVVVIDNKELKLYENGDWYENVFIYSEIDCTLSDIETVSEIENLLSKTDWDKTMNFYTLGELRKGLQIYYKAKTGKYVKMPEFNGSLYAGKVFIIPGKLGMIDSIVYTESYNYSKTSDSEKKRIIQAIDSLKIDWNKEYSFLTAGKREINSLLYYTSSKGVIGKLSLGIDFELFDGELNVLVDKSGRIVRIGSDTTTTTTTSSVLDPLDGYLSDDTNYLQTDERYLMD